MASKVEVSLGKRSRGGLAERRRWRKLSKSSSAWAMPAAPCAKPVRLARLSSSVCHDRAPRASRSPALDQLVGELGGAREQRGVAAKGIRAEHERDRRAGNAADDIGDIRLRRLQWQAQQQAPAGCVVSSLRVLFRPISALLLCRQRLRKSRAGRQSGIFGGARGHLTQRTARFVSGPSPAVRRGLCQEPADAGSARYTLGT